MLVKSKKLAHSNEDDGGFNGEMDGDTENMDVVNNNDEDLVVFHCGYYGLNMLPKSKSLVTFEGLVVKEERDVIKVHEDEGEDKVVRKLQNNLGTNKKMLSEDED